jgi:hypothetical protein
MASRLHVTPEDKKETPPSILKLQATADTPLIKLFEFKFVQKGAKPTINLLLPEERGLAVLMETIN